MATEAYTTIQQKAFLKYFPRLEITESYITGLSTCVKTLSRTKKHDNYTSKMTRPLPINIHEWTEKKEQNTWNFARFVWRITRLRLNQTWQTMCSTNCP